MVRRQRVSKDTLRGRDLGDSTLVVVEEGGELEGVGSAGVEELDGVLDVLLVGLLHLERRGEGGECGAEGEGCACSLLEGGEALGNSCKCFHIPRDGEAQMNSGLLGIDG